MSAESACARRRWLHAPLICVAIWLLADLPVWLRLAAQDRFELLRMEVLVPDGAGMPASVSRSVIDPHWGTLAVHCGHDARDFPIATKMMAMSGGKFPPDTGLPAFCRIDTMFRARVDPQRTLIEDSALERLLAAVGVVARPQQLTDPPIFPPTSSAQSVLAAAGVAVNRGDYSYALGTYNRLGPVSIAVLVHAVIALLLIVAFSAFRGWHTDFDLLVQGMRRSPWLLLAPVLVGSGLLVLGHAIVPLLSVLGTEHHLEAILLAPVSEELLYRFLMFEWLRRNSNAAFAAVFLAALFAWNHHYPLPQALAAFGFSIGAHYLYIRYQSISGCIAMHIVANGSRHAGRYLASIF
jgi:membrane protease YdiL (CAAX protease family)